MEHTQYRILELPYRKRNAVISYNYHIQILIKNFWGKWNWDTIKEYRCYGTDCYWQIIEFNTEQDAKNHINLLKKPIPKYKIIDVN